MKATTLLLGAFTLTATRVSAQSLERAELFKDHGLTEDAKKELILVVTSSTNDASKARA